MERRSWTMWVLVPAATLLLLTLYFTSNLPHSYTAPSSLEQQPSREFLRLLETQEQGIIDLLRNSSQASSVSSILSLNRRMQQLLSGRTNLPQLCKQGDAPASSREIDKLVKWEPRRDYYLLVICTSGQISNHLICLEKHMFFAALLKRTLVLPSPSMDYDYNKTLDLAHIRSCLGVNTVISFQELVSRGKTSVSLLCFMHDCYFDKEHEDKLRAVGVSVSKKLDAWPEESSLKGYPSHPKASEFLSKFSVEDEVLGIGDVFYADVEEKMVEQVGGPLLHSCKSLLRPNRLIVLTAQRFVQTFLGDGFLALHFRRHGFLKFCNVKPESCFFPVPQAAQCILNRLQSLSSRVIYISTDAADSEINLLQSLLVSDDGKTIPLVRRPSTDSREKWDALLQRKGLLADNEVVAMLDKTICAMASSYIGTPGSTFSDDIMRMRREWGTASSCDAYLCEGEHPNFIADVN